MTVTNSIKDFDNLTMTLTAEFEATVERVWELWADPRQLEKWWGPPTYPATVEHHDLQAGGSVAYYMTGPEGDKHYGWWHIDVVNPPSSLQFTDGFADENGRPVDDMPVSHVHVHLSEHGGRTQMEIISIFASAAEMKQVIEMGMEEGIRLAVGQMDALLEAAPRS